MTDTGGGGAFPRVALTGGICTGKSTVAAMFGDLGAAILDADAAAREVVKPGVEGWLALRAMLPPALFDASGNLLRRELRSAIIADPALRLRVEAALHPPILRLLEEEWERCRAATPPRPAIFDIPLLFEAALHVHFDVIVLAYAPRETQIARLMARDGATREEALATLAMQRDIEEKRALSHLVIDNSGSLDATRRQVKAAWRNLFEGERAVETTA